MSMAWIPIINIPDSPTPATMKGSPCPIDSHTGESSSPLKHPTRTESYFRVNKIGVIIIYDSDEEVKEAAANLLIPTKIPDTPPIQTVRVKVIEGGLPNAFQRHPSFSGVKVPATSQRDPFGSCFHRLLRPYLDLCPPRTTLAVLINGGSAKSIGDLGFFRCPQTHAF